MPRKTPKRECPPELQDFIDLLNEVPRLKAQADAFAADYHRLSEDALENLNTYGPKAQDISEPLPSDARLRVRSRNVTTINSEFYSRPEFQKYPRTLKALGLTRYFVAWNDLEDIRTARARVIGLIEQTRPVLINSDKLHDDDRRIDFDVHLGSLPSRAVTFLINNQSLLVRLLVCPICEDIKWMKTPRTKTCGKAKCVQRLADIARGKSSKDKKQ